MLDHCFKVVLVRGDFHTILVVRNHEYNLKIRLYVERLGAVKTKHWFAFLMNFIKYNPLLSYSRMHYSTFHKQWDMYTCWVSTWIQNIKAKCVFLISSLECHKILIIQCITSNKNSYSGYNYTNICVPSMWKFSPGNVLHVFGSVWHIQLSQVENCAVILINTVHGYRLNAHFHSNSNCNMCKSWYNVIYIVVLLIFTSHMKK